MFILDRIKKLKLLLKLNNIYFLVYNIHHIHSYDRSTLVDRFFQNTVIYEYTTSQSTVSCEI